MDTVLSIHRLIVQQYFTMVLGCELFQLVKSDTSGISSILQRLGRVALCEEVLAHFRGELRSDIEGFNGGSLAVRVYDDFYHTSVLSCVKCIVHQNAHDIQKLKFRCLGCECGIFDIYIQINIMLLRKVHLAEQKTCDQFHVDPQKIRILDDMVIAGGIQLI